MMKQRIYIIGTGVISQHHANARNALPRETELYAADLNPAAREKFQQANPDVILFDSSDEMLAHAPAEPTDIACVSTPPKFHASETLKALRSGRNVLCEKPFAMSVEEAESMVAEAKRLGLSVSCCSNRFIGWDLNQKLATLIKEGGIGRPYLVDFIHRTVCGRAGIEGQQGSFWFLDKSKSGGGPLMDWGPYDLAVLTTVLAPLRVSVLDAVVEQAKIPAELPEGTVYDVESQLAATLRFELSGGEQVSVRYERSCATHGNAYDSEGIYGTEGYVKWNWLPFGDDLKISVQTTTGKDAQETREIKGTPYPEGDDWVVAPLREMDRYLRGDKNAKVLVNDHAINTFALLRAIYQAGESKEMVHVEF